ncbi:hypothetical protein [Streptomyces sp. NPDC012888]|uniref:hypothetical protein n=1 Tax=Streptomyces sp. NPDC012888 TaxID=3364855 RepID=UPI0036BBCFD1
MNARGTSRQPAFRFTAEERAVLDEGLARILAEREAQEWAAAVGAAIPALVRAAAEATERETRADDA